MDDPKDLLSQAYARGLTSKREGILTDYFRTQGYLAAMIDCGVFYGDRLVSEKAERLLRSLQKAKP